MVKDTGPWLKTLEKPVVTAGGFALSTGVHENSRYEREEKQRESSMDIF